MQQVDLYQHPAAVARAISNEAVLNEARQTRAAVLWQRFATEAWPARTSVAVLLVLLTICALATMLYLRTLAAVGAMNVDQTALLAVFVAAAVSSVAGFAFSAVAGALLVHIIDGPVRIAQILLICSIGMQIMMVWSLRGSIAWRHLGRFLAGGLIGIPIGLWLLFNLPQASYARALGIIIVACGAWRLYRRHVVLSHRYPTGDFVAGTIGGITGGLASFPSSSVTIWCGLQGWDKIKQRSLVQPFILTMQIFTLAALYATGSAHRGAAIDLSAFAYFPPAILGTICGLAVFFRLDERQFVTAVNATLVVAGLAMTI